MSDVPLLGIPTWQIRLMCDQPEERIIDYKEQMQDRQLRPVLTQARTLIGRTSYMVNGPNREIKWSIERWVVDGKHAPQWVTILQGISTLRRGMKPN